MNNTKSLLLSKKYNYIKRDGFLAELHVDGKNTSKKMHYHDYYEIIFYLGQEESTYHSMNRSRIVKRGDIILCKIFESHHFEIDNTKSSDRFVIGLDGTLLLNYSFSGINLTDIFFSESGEPIICSTEFKEFTHYSDIILEYLNLPDTKGKIVMQRALIYQILANLYVTYGSEHATNSEKTEKMHRVAIVSNIISYIEENLSKDISLPELARSVNYSVSYISRIFKESSGETLTNYIIKKRLEKAEVLILTGVPTAQAAEQVGFNNYSYFYRIFKREVGINPTEYRAAYHRTSS